MIEQNIPSMTQGVLPIVIGVLYYNRYNVFNILFISSKAWHLYILTYFTWNLKCIYLMLHDVLQHGMA